MKTHLLLFVAFLGGFYFIQAQNDIWQVDPFQQRASDQQELYPIEKVYLHTDLPYYLKGDTIWFRAYLVDADSHRPLSVSKYVYVELKSPLDSTVSRLKIINDKGIYAGYLPLPANLAEGNYTLFGYSMYMIRQGTDCFFRKNIPVMNSCPPSIQANVRFQTDRLENKLTAEISFRNREGLKQVKDDLYYQVDGGKPEAVQIRTDSMWHIELLPESNLLRIQSGGLQKYISVPSTEETYNVSFFPEGGYLIEDAVCGIAFESLNSRGVSEEISGQLVDNRGGEILSFKSIHAGMGLFHFKPEKDKQYHVVCRNKNGTEKRFTLPAARKDTYSLKAVWINNRLIVSVRCSPDMQRSDSLILSIRSLDRLIFASEWDWKRAYISLDKNSLPSGLSQILLLDQAGNMISKRLIGCRDEKMQPEINTDKPFYCTRERVKVEVALPGSMEFPSQGSFSASVTDDSKIFPDSGSSIRTYLLLDSELKGNIESPDFYFIENHRESFLALDVLMMVHGWTRYSVPDEIKGKYEKPGGYLEIGQEISGCVTTKFRKKPVAGVKVFIMAKDRAYADAVLTDENGCFRFNGFDFPENTNYEIKVVSPDEAQYNIRIDEEPPVFLTCKATNQSVPSDFLKIAEPDVENRPYAYDMEKMTVNLDEVIVKGNRKQQRVSPFQSFASKSFDSDYLNENVITDIDEILRSVPGASVYREKVYLSPGAPPAVFWIDGMIMDNLVENSFSYSRDTLGNPVSIKIHSGVGFDYKAIPVQDIEQIDIVKPRDATIFGPGAMGGVVMITTKKGGGRGSDRKSDSMLSIVPLGFQNPVEFYSPSYETKEQEKSRLPDLRKTVYWNPDISVSKEGRATFDFYTSDLPSGYTLTIEGVLNNGEIIRATKKIEVKLE